MRLIFLIISCVLVQTMFASDINVITPDGCFPKEYNLVTYSEQISNTLKEHLKSYDTSKIEEWETKKIFQFGYACGQQAAYADIVKMSKYGNTFMLQHCTD